MQALPQPEEQTVRRALLVDQNLVVKGSGGRIFALGDAATVAAAPASSLPPTAQVRHERMGVPALRWADPSHQSHPLVQRLLQVARQQGEYIANLLNHGR